MPPVKDSCPEDALLFPAPPPPEPELVAFPPFLSAAPYLMPLLPYEPAEPPFSAWSLPPPPPPYETKNGRGKVAGTNKFEEVIIVTLSLPLF